MAPSARTRACRSPGTPAKARRCRSRTRRRSRRDSDRPAAARICRAVLHPQPDLVHPVVRLSGSAAPPAVHPRRRAGCDLGHHPRSTPTKITTLGAAYQAFGNGQESFSGNVHATLDLGQEFEVIVGLTSTLLGGGTSSATSGLPVETIASTPELRRGGQRAAGRSGSVTSPFVSRHRDQPLRRIAGLHQDPGHAVVPGEGHQRLRPAADFRFAGSLSPDTPISLTALLDDMLGSPGGLPDVSITELGLSAFPSAGSYSLFVTPTARSRRVSTASARWTWRSTRPTASPAG